MILQGENGYAIVFMHKGVDYAWALMPQMMRRVGSFHSRYEPGSCESVFTDDVMKSFVDGDGRWTMVAAVKDGQVNAHMLVHLEEWYGSFSLNVVQFEIDRGCGLPRDLLQQGWAVIVDMAKHFKVGEIRCFAESERHMRAYGIYYKLKPFRYLLRLEVQ